MIDMILICKETFQVNQVMDKFDNDSDGLLDIEEFKLLMNRNQRKKTDN